jgi:hypothetical protein
VAERETGAKSAVTPRQLLMIGALGVVLVIVLVWQFGASGSAPLSAESGTSSIASASGAARSAGPNTAASVAQAGEPKTVLASWPKFTAEAAAAYDPFAVPPAMNQKITASTRAAEDRKSLNSPPKRDANAEKMAALKNKGITLIVRGERGALALVGDRVVRVGDVLEGYRVLSIDLRGVVLAPADRQEAHEVRP